MTQDTNKKPEGKKAKRLSIDETVRQTIAATLITRERMAQDTFKQTEKRLYAYPVIKLKVVDDREKIDEVRQYGAPGRSKSVIKYQRSGVRLTPEEIAEALIQDITAEIAGNEHELEIIEKALVTIAGDQYADIVKYKYFEGKNDDEIAALIPCDPSTVRRQKNRLVGRLALFLYGVAALA